MEFAGVDPVLECGPIEVRDDSDFFERDDFSFCGALRAPRPARVSAAQDEEGFGFDGDPGLFGHATVSLLPISGAIPSDGNEWSLR